MQPCAAGSLYRHIDSISIYPGEVGPNWTDLQFFVFPLSVTVHWSSWGVSALHKGTSAVGVKDSGGVLLIHFSPSTFFYPVLLLSHLCSCCPFSVKSPDKSKQLKIPLKKTSQLIFCSWFLRLNLNFNIQDLFLVRTQLQWDYVQIEICFLVFLLEHSIYLKNYF